MTLPPDQLLRIAREERARRKAAWTSIGQAANVRARQDDLLWSNIEQMAGVAAGDANCLTRQPHHWNDQQRIIMARNAWATLRKAEASLDATIAANAAKISDLYQLYKWLRPICWSPFFETDTTQARAA